MRPHYSSVSSVCSPFFGNYLDNTLKHLKVKIRIFTKENFSKKKRKTIFRYT